MDRIRHIEGPLRHSLCPNWSEEALKQKMAAKHERIERAQELFQQYSKLAAERKRQEEEAKEAAWLAYKEGQFASRTRCYGGQRLDYTDNIPFNLGRLVPKDPARLPIYLPHTAINDALFVFNERTNHFEVNQMGSAVIVGLLELYKMSSGTPKKEDDQPAALPSLMFFDYEGNFYYSAHLLSLELSAPENEYYQQQHTATFAIPKDGGMQKISLAISDICSITYTDGPV